ncbi:DUF6382 domain-containing protein [Oribacterium sp. WCC10]|uniref:DUF6382 domain-containing protein n=1 Tax=Oribacterium sp. WCC10 TaxID=1855343 RepID=UPI0008EF468D|nr:DUF6382 domain-containing protein [Oribacterium sp. WCC10]SFG33953.1 hypothetical protein SAMN05216356_10634 [Oribacterium sp. WCC10]
MENNISYEHSLRHSYMHIQNISISQDAYETKMLIGTHIPGTLKFNLDNISTDPLLSYDISGLESMKSYLESNPLSHVDLSAFMESLNKLFSSLDEYMISENSVLLSPSAVFYNPDNSSWNFTIIPDFKNVFHESLSEFLTYLLKHIDYKDDRAVIMGYSMFQESSKEFYQLSDLMRIVRNNIAKENQSVNVKKDSSTTPSEKRMISDDGIFRPIDAGIILKSDDKNPASSSQSPASFDIIADSITDTSDKYTPTESDDPYIEDSSDSGIDSFNLSKPEPRSLFSSFSSYGKKSDIPATPEEDIQVKNTIQSRISEKNAKNSIKIKGFITVLLMLMIPSMVWFLKGGLIFKRTLPLILALEVGLSMMIALDFIMHKLPEDA